MQTGNNEFQKRANMVLVAECIYKNGEISRAAIAKELGLFRSTVSNLVQQLLQLGVVEERTYSTSTEKGGRKGLLLGIRGKAGVIAGVELEKNGFNYVLIDIAGRTVAKGELENIENSGFSDMFYKTAGFVSEKAVSLAVPLLGISIGMSGIIDAKKGEVIRSGIFSLRKFDFVQEIAAKFDFPVLIENDARACAWGELWENREVNTFCYLYYRLSECWGSVVPGFSFGVVVDRIVHAGANSISGELFQTHRIYINRRYRDMFLTILDGGESSVRKIKEDFPDVVYDLQNMISFLDPDTIFIGNQLKSKIDLFSELFKLDFGIDQDEPEMKKFGDSSSYHFKSDYSVVSSSLKDFEVARGAACCFLKKLYSVPQIGKIEGYAKIGWEDLFSSRP